MPDTIIRLKNGKVIKIIELDTHPDHKGEIKIITKNTKHSESKQ